MLLLNFVVAHGFFFYLHLHTP